MGEKIDINHALNMIRFSLNKTNNNRNIIRKYYQMGQSF